MHARCQTSRVCIATNLGRRCCAGITFFKPSTIVSRYGLGISSGSQSRSGSMPIRSMQASFELSWFNLIDARPRKATMPKMIDFNPNASRINSTHATILKPSSAPGLRENSTACRKRPPSSGVTGRRLKRLRKRKTRIHCANTSCGKNLR